MSNLTSPKVFGTGLLALDLVVSADPQRSIQSWAGGTCGNVLSILAYMGWDSFPIARLNYDPAAARIAADFERWGVHLDFLHSAPTVSTPIIIQENLISRDGVPRHKFSWTCPRCGNWLPSFRPITRAVIDSVGHAVDDASVFFLDRISRAAITLARRAADHGALVVFEPSGRSDPKLFVEAIQIAHIVKYADQRLSDAIVTMSGDNSTLLEIQTLGSKGLRFRHKLDGQSSGWIELQAAPADLVIDTCGSGDWCTAGLLDRLAREGRRRFETQSTESITAALQHGQVLAAWNCGYEGARGGMYQESDARANANLSKATADISTSMVDCPACGGG